MAKAENEMTYTFLVEWYDNHAEMPRQYTLAYFLADGTIEMYDCKNRRTFLKRCVYPDLLIDDLFIGAQVTVYARQLRVLDFADAFTRRALAQAKTKITAVLKPQALPMLGEVIDQLYQARTTVSRVKSVKFALAQAMEYFKDDKPTERARELARGTVVAIEVIGPEAATIFAGITLADGTGAIIVGSGSDEEAAYLFDNPRLAATAVQGDCTVCVVKPHAVLAGDAGAIIHRLQKENFSISAVQLCNLDRAAATEFLDVYQSVLPEFNSMIDEFTKGPCYVMELTGADVHPRLRALCGPLDPQIARHLAPKCLRAMFGQDKVKNAVHCTDLPEDGALESGFFFETVQQVEAIKQGKF